MRNFFRKLHPSPPELIEGFFALVAIVLVVWWATKFGYYLGTL